MKSKLERCLFYHCATAPSVHVRGDNVVFSFTAAKQRSHIMTMCCGTFKNSGSYQSHEVADKGAADTDAATNTAVPVSGDATAPEATLARRSGVEDIKQLAAGLSAAECHSLSVFFGLKYLQRAHAPTLGVTATILVQKSAAAHVFAEASASEWQRLLTEYSAKVAPPQGCKCKCRCGCSALSASCVFCLRCQRPCCQHCHPASCQGKASAALQPYFARSDFARDGLTPICHHCAGAPKYSVIPLKPPRHMDGLMWYFGAPHEEPKDDFDRRDRPCRWCNPNRNPNMDPMLLDIVEVSKDERFENTTRHVRPPAWESAFTVAALLGSKDGSERIVHINLFSFVMNQVWRSHPVVKYIRDDWLARPESHDYVGNVLKPPPLPPVAALSLPSPSSPVLESTVTVEDVTGDGEEETCESDKDKEAEFEELRRSLQQRKEAAAEEFCSGLKRLRRA